MIQKLVSIEDNDDHFDIMAFHIEQWNPELALTRYSNGEDALGAIDRLEQEPPDLILLDMNLPKYSGLEVCERLKSHGKLKAIPVVMFTTSSADKEIAAAYACGVNSYMVKPLEDEGGMKSALHQILSYWSLNQSRVMDE